MNWEPIESAPKDGTRVDLWAVNVFGEAKRFAGCYWEVATYEFHHDRWIGLPEGRKSWKPTHWMPLPKPPNTRMKT